MSKSDVEEALQTLKNEIEPSRREKPKTRCCYCGALHEENSCPFYSGTSLKVGRAYAFLRGAVAYLTPFKKTLPNVAFSLELKFEGILFKIEYPYIHGHILKQEIVIPWEDFNDCSFNPLIAVFDSICHKQGLLS